MPLDYSAADRYAQEAPAPPKASKSIGKAPYAALIAGSLGDLLSTVVALKNPKLKEGNPVLGQNPLVIAGAKAAGTGTIGALMHMADKKDHDKFAKGIAIAVTALNAALTVNNVRQMRKARR